MDPDELPSEAEAAACVTRRGVGRARVVGSRSGGGGGRWGLWRWRWVLLVVAAAMLPTALGTGWGRAWLMQRVNARIPGHLAAREVRLSWFGWLAAEGVVLQGADDGEVARVKAVILSDAGLWSLLTGTRELGAVTVQGARLHLERDAAGRMNLDRALGTSWFGGPGGAGEVSDTAEREPPDGAGDKGGTGGGGPAVPPGLVVDVTLRDVAATMTGTGFETVAVTLPEATLTVAGPTRLGLTLRATVEQGADSGRVELAATVDDLFNEVGRWTVGAARFDVDGSVFRLPLAAMDRLLGWGDASVLAGASGAGALGGVQGHPPDRGGKLTALLGPRLDASVRLKGGLADADGLLIAESERLTLRQPINFDERRVTVRDDFGGGPPVRRHRDDPPGTPAALPTGGVLTLTPDAWAAILGDEAPALLDPVRLLFTVDEFEAPRARGALDLPGTRYGVSLQTVGGEPLRLDVPERGTLEATLNVRVGSTEADRAATLRVGSDLTIGDAGGRLEAVVEARRGDAGWQAGTVEAVLAALPMPVLDALTGQGDRLTATLGKSVGLGVLATADGRGGYGLTVDFNPADLGGTATGGDAGPRLQGQLTGRYGDDGAVELHTDQRLTLRLTPEAFELWQQPATAAAGAATPDGTVGLSLIEPMRLDVDVDLQAALRDGPGLRFDPDRTALNLGITLPETTLHDRWYDRRFRLVNGRVTVDAPDLREPVTVAVVFETDRHAEDGPNSPPSTPGRLTADATVTGLMLDDGYLQVERAVLAGGVGLTDLPTAVFDALTRQRGYAVAAFGRELSATLSTEGFSLAAGGPADFELNSANGSVGSLPALVSPDKTLTLRAPSTFYLNATPELSSRILRLVNPIVLPAVVSASVPIVITLDDDGFTVPLDGFDWRRVNADARVMMNRVTIVPNVAPMDRIIPKLVRFNLLPDRPEYVAKIAPIVLSIRDGVLAYERLPIGLDDVELDFGGRIDLANRGLDMTLTVGGEAFEKDEFLKSLGSIDVAIGGSIDEPTVQMQALERLLRDAARDVGRDLIRQGADKLLDSFRRDEKQ